MRFLRVVAMPQVIKKGLTQPVMPPLHHFKMYAESMEWAFLNGKHFVPRTRPWRGPLPDGMANLKRNDAVLRNIIDLKHERFGTFQQVHEEANERALMEWEDLLSRRCAGTCNLWKWCNREGWKLSAFTQRRWNCTDVRYDPACDPSWKAVNFALTESEAASSLPMTALDTGSRRSSDESEADFSCIANVKVSYDGC